MIEHCITNFEQLATSDNRRDALLIIEAGIWGLDNGKVVLGAGILGGDNLKNKDQIFYLNQRGISTEDAVNMIVNGFCKEVFKELPMEFAVEAQKLLAVSLEGSVG